MFKDLKEYSDKAELIADFHRERKANKGKWVFFKCTLKGNLISLKSYDTWIQVAFYNANRDGTPTNLTVKRLNGWLNNFLRDNPNEVQKGGA